MCKRHGRCPSPDRPNAGHGRAGGSSAPSLRWLRFVRLRLGDSSGCNWLHSRSHDGVRSSERRVAHATGLPPDDGRRSATGEAVHGPTARSARLRVANGCTSPGGQHPDDGVGTVTVARAGLSRSGAHSLAGVGGESDKRCPDRVGIHYSSIIVIFCCSALANPVTRPAIAQWAKKLRRPAPL